MVKTTGVRGPTLARLATVSVLCRAGGKPSTLFPPETRRADHLIGNYSRFSVDGERLKLHFQLQNIFSKIFMKFEKNIIFLNILIKRRAGC